MFARPPAPGMALEIRSGLYWKRLPLNQPPNHVNLWLLRDDTEGWTAVDAGANRGNERALWEKSLASLDEPNFSRLIITHAHYDHAELAGWVAERLDASLWMPRDEFLVAATTRGGSDISAFWDLMTLAGCPLDLAPVVIDNRERFPKQSAHMPKVFTRIKDGDELVIGGRLWRAMTSDGHSIEQLALHAPDDNVLIGADHVLPRAAPSIALRSFERGADPVGAAFEMHERLLRLDPETLVLPSHGRPFLGLHARVRELRAFRQGRLAAMAGAVADRPMTAYEILHATSPRIPTPPFMPIALSEMMAYLRHLEVRGVLASEPNDAGALLYRTA